LFHLVVNEQCYIIYNEKKYYIYDMSQLSSVPKLSLHHTFPCQGNNLKEAIVSFSFNQIQNIGIADTNVDWEYIPANYEALGLMKKINGSFVFITTKDFCDLHYNISTAKGDCGSLIIGKNINKKYKILGMHLFSGGNGVFNSGLAFKGLKWTTFNQENKNIFLEYCSTGDSFYAQSVPKGHDFAIYRNKALSLIQNQCSRF